MNEAQHQQVRSILEAQKPSVAPLVRDLVEKRHLLCRERVQGAKLPFASSLEGLPLRKPNSP